MNSGKQWVVVVEGGTVDEYKAGEFASFAKAFACARRIERDEGCKADVMKRAGDGALTTEY